MMKRFLKAVVVVLLLAFSLEWGVPARGQLIEIGKARRRRVGRVVLPTPPFNPDAPVLADERGRGRNRQKTAASSNVRKAGRTGHRRPRQVPPRKVRRYRHLR